jgi:hypothetical protein
MSHDTAIRINRNTPVGFEVLSAVDMKTFIFWYITPCSPMEVNRRLGGIATFFPPDPEDGGDVFLLNVDCLSMDCKALYHRKQNSSKIRVFYEF